ncbi:MAG: DUF4159 domain-containing protein [Balneolaceae bacterium]
MTSRQFPALLPLAFWSIILCLVLPNSSEGTKNHRVERVEPVRTTSPTVVAITTDTFRLARVEYRGSGDWYSSPTALTNLIRYAREQLPISLDSQYDDVALSSRELHNYPFLFLTGHGHIEVDESELNNLRRYLDNGGFLYVDDDYGLDPYVRPILERLFPSTQLQELPPDHPIYHNLFHFPEGRPPKIHEHDGLPPQAFGIYRNGRLAVLYTYESNPSDGWEHDRHNNPDELVETALKFGLNLLVHVFTSDR